MNAGRWFHLSGELSNRVVDLECYLEPTRQLFESFKATARESDNAAQLMNDLEKLEAYLADANTYVQALRAVSDEMDKEVEWYGKEFFDLPE